MSTCEYEYNTEFERWDTECGDMIVLLNNESPFGYGFRFCPFCGGNSIETGESEDSETVEEVVESN